MFWGKLGFIMLNSFCLIITLYTIDLVSVLKQRFSSPWAWMSHRCPGFAFFPKMNHLQHRFLSATTAEVVEGRQAGKDGKRREFQKGNRHNTCGVKKAASILPLKERVSKTYPSHKIAAEVNLFVHEAFRYYSKYYQKVYKEKILIWQSLDTTW